MLILSLQVVLLAHKNHKHSQAFSFFISKRKHASLSLWEETSEVKEKDPRTQDHLGPKLYFQQWLSLIKDLEFPDTVLDEE